MAVELFREMVRRTVKDPDVAESLSPRGYPLGCKRPVLDSSYFETFNRDNVTLVDLGRDPIQEVTATGIRTEQRFVELDLLVLATGFDAMTGALDAHRRPRAAAVASCATTGPTGHGRTSASAPRATRTSSSASGPAAPVSWRPIRRRSSSSSVGSPTSSDYIVDHGYTRAEADVDAQDEWGEHVNAVARGTMFTADSCNSWYNGANIEGKARVFLPYVGGLPKYMDRCNEVAAQGYDGFVLS